MELGNLSLDNVLNAEQVENLFMPQEDTSAEEVENEAPEGQESTSSEKGSPAEEIDPETLFSEDNPESVGSGEAGEQGGKEEASPSEGEGSSPQKSFYSSIALALTEDGILSHLDPENLKDDLSDEDLNELIEEEVNSRFDERQKRINTALESGVEPSDISKYESTLNYLSSITDANLTDESEKGEQLRSRLIYQDYLNKGMSPDKARKLTDRSINAGTDIDDAKEALQSNKEFFETQYNTLLNEAKQQAEADKAERTKQAEKLKNTLLKDTQLWGDMEIGNDIRKKAIDNISKPIYRDPDTGEYFTAIQKYEKDNRFEFLKNLTLAYTLTNGFKDFDTLFKKKVNKEVKKGMKALEQKIISPSRNTDGSLKLVTRRTDDSESFINKGYTLDL